MNLHKLFPVAALALCASACSDGDDSDTDEPSECAERVGTYSNISRVRSGDCGEISEILETVDRQPTEVESPCTGTIDYAPDNCTVVTEATCPAEDLGPGWTSTFLMHAKWNQSGSRGEAVLQVSVDDDSGANVCFGTYDVEVTRL